MRKIVSTLALVSLLGACGGASVEAPAPDPEPAPTVATEPVERAEPEPEPDPRAGLIWYVYWEGIHCLTVYPSAGLIRSEEPHNAQPPFSTRSEEFSLISVYYEHEHAWAPEIEAAADLDDLLARLAAMEGVEVEEALNPIQTTGY